MGVDYDCTVFDTFAVVLLLLDAFSTFAIRGSQALDCVCCELNRGGT